MLGQVEKKDIPRAGAVLADTFRHDPVCTKVFEADVENDRKMGAWYEAPVRYCLRYGEVYATSEHLEGIAAWVPGELADMTTWRMIRSGAIRSGMKMGMAMARHAQKIFEPLEADRKANMKGRSYLYVMIVGVASEFQGQGFGGKLLGALIKRSVQVGRSLYLETATERNVRMYERLGFKLLKQIILPVINLPQWEMVRELKTEESPEDVFSANAERNR